MNGILCQLITRDEISPSAFREARFIANSEPTNFDVHDAFDDGGCGVDFGDLFLAMIAGWRIEHKQRIIIF